MKRILALGVLTALASCSSNPPVATTPAPTAATSAPAAPVATTPAPMPSAMVAAPSAFHPSRLVAGRDSFVAFAGGQQLGTAILTLAREGPNFRYKVDIGLPMMGVAQHYESVFDATTLMPISAATNGSMQGMVTSSRIDIANGRAKGTTQEPTPTGITTSNVDLAVPSGVVDDQSGLALLTTLDLAPGFTTSFTSLEYSPTSVHSNDVTVQGTETIIVPAGTFEAYRILVHSKDDAVAYLTVAKPHRIVLVRVENGAVELRLAK